MKKAIAILALAAFILPATIGHAQDPVVFEINGEKIHQSEFMKEFLRSMDRNTSATTAAEKHKAVKEYADLFANYRAKLADAYAMGIDTMEALNRELKQYRDELAAPYLIDSATMDAILHEAYDRNHYAVHAAHILIRVGAGDSAEDTLKAYQKAMSYYTRAKAGEDFYRLAQESVNEQRKQVPGEISKPNPQEGDLGCFTVFDMVYPFENACYTLDSGAVSMPVRTRFGYHVIKLFFRVPYYGRTRMSHIWVRDDVNPGRAEARIKMAYEGLQGGATFADMARQHSDDMNTNTSGGQMPELELKQMPPEYVMEISKGLKVGEYSKPFKTQYGWHIILLQGRDTIPSYEDMVPFYKQRLTRDQRSKNPREIYANNAKKRYNFADYTQTYVKNKKGKDTKKTMASLDNLKQVLTDSVFYKTWKFDTAAITDMRPIMQLAGKDYTLVDLGKYIEKHQQKESVYDLPMYVEYKYKDFVNDEAIAYADVHLEQENKEFADLVEEYRHGMMIFAYNEQMIWGKAVKDSAGFAQYYAQESVKKNFANEADAPYFWNERARVKVVTVGDSASLDPAKAMKILAKGDKKNWGINDLESSLKKEYKAASDRKGDSLSVDLQVVEKGKQTMLGENEWKVGTYCHPLGHGYQIMEVEKIAAPQLKSLTEARGYYMNDYQNYTEQQLNSSLRKKYNVKINQAALDKITY